MILVELKDYSLDNLNWKIKVFTEINYLKQFLRKNIKQKIFLLCVHKVEKKMKITYR